ncbi:uncharacterized protein LOC113790738 isoform X2 [Dermatophagoides pteronyssinus]|uniref:Uncharacterized protein LOC113790738 isoform X2 n=1 Tax=Dermatophagoides pteronyssinus TaxID=6956 RepID=A0A6P6XWF7_DERPT|nr:uncharacterized protein LOC113790738 isoform X2 [Dermatophagoides pteronyssinus]
MANQDSNEYYSYSKLEKFRRYERCFRSVQAILLLFMIICFVFYMITFGIDIAKFMNDPPLLAATVIIDIIAMIFLVIGIRGVAFESFCMVLTFAIIFCLVTIAHGVTFLFRHPGLTGTNLVLALLLFIGSIIYLYYLCRMNRLKPPDYGKTYADSRRCKKNNEKSDEDDTESSMALNSPQIDTTIEKIVTDVKSGFTDLNRGLTDSTEREYSRIKREMGNVKAGFDDEVETVKKEFGNLQATAGKNVEKEFVAVKRVLLNEAQTLRDGVEREYDNLRVGLNDAKREISGDIDRLSNDAKGRYGDLEKELRGSFKSAAIGDAVGGGNTTVQRMISSVQKGFEEFKSGGENVKREIVEVKRDEAGNITSYIERRLTDSGVEICSVSVDKNRAPMANFTNT